MTSKLQQVYGDRSMSMKQDFVWVKQFQNGGVHVTDIKRSRHWTASGNDPNMGKSDINHRQTTHKTTIWNSLVDFLPTKWTSMTDNY
jgi:hypothetical protein